MKKAAQTELVKDLKKETHMMVKVKTLRDIKLPGGVEIQAGTVTEMTEENAKEFCDRTFEAPLQMSGEYANASFPQSKIARAIRL